MTPSLSAAVDSKETWSCWLPHFDGRNNGAGPVEGPWTLLRRHLLGRGVADLDASGPARCLLRGCNHLRTRDLQCQSQYCKMHCNVVTMDYNIVPRMMQAFQCVCSKGGAGCLCSTYEGTLKLLHHCMSVAGHLSMLAHGSTFTATAASVLWLCCCSNNFYETPILTSNFYGIAQSSFAQANQCKWQ